MTRFTAALHSATPGINATGSAGTPVIALRLLRHPGAPGEPARFLPSLIVDEVSTRTVRQYGCRALRDASGHLLPDAVTITTLSGQVVMLRTADGDTTHALSDAATRPLWTHSAQGTVNTFGYEPAGSAGRQLNVTETTTAGWRRERERFSYAAADDPKAKACNLAGVVTVHHDNAGVTKVLRIAVTGQPLLKKQHLLPAKAQEPDWSATPFPETEAPLSVSGTFDAAGAPLTQTNAVCVTTVNAYDVSGAVCETRLRYAQNSGGPIDDILTLQSVLRQADGTVLSHTAGNDVTQAYTYDPKALRLVRHITARPSGHPQGARLLADVHYGYDPAGNIMTLDDKGADPVWHSNQQATGLRTYAYDTLYRLASATGRERALTAKRCGPHADTTAASVWSPYSELYHYDDGDNLIKTVHAGSTPWTRNTAVSARSNRGVTTGAEVHTDPHEAYLPGGLQRALNDGRALGWRADGQLGQVSQVTRNEGEMDDEETYRYANPGTRARKVRTEKASGRTLTTVTTYAAGAQWRTRSLDSADTRTSALQVDVQVTEAGATRVIRDVLKGEAWLRYSICDHLGSVSIETDAEGNVTSREEYLPYGDSAGSDEEASEIHDRTRRFSGKERDASGLYYYGWRYCQTSAGRWLSADPAGLIDGANLFRFCRNNPVIFFDADGQAPETGVYVRDHGITERIKLKTLLTVKPPAIAVYDATRNEFVKSPAFTAVRMDEEKHQIDLITNTLAEYKKRYEELEGQYDKAIAASESLITSLESSKSSALELQDTEDFVSAKTLEIDQEQQDLKKLRELLSNAKLGSKTSSKAMELFRVRYNLTNTNEVMAFAAMKSSDVKTATSNEIYGIHLAATRTSEETMGIELHFAFTIANPLSQLPSGNFKNEAQRTFYQEKYPNLAEFQTKGVGAFLMAAAYKYITGKQNITRLTGLAENVRSAATGLRFGGKLNPLTH